MDEVPNLPINEMRDALGEGWGLDKDEVAERLKRLLNKVADMPPEKRAHLLKSLVDRHEQLGGAGAWDVLLSPYTLVAVAVTVVVMIFLFLAYKIFQREMEKKRKQEEKKKLKEEKKKK